MQVWREPPGMVEAAQASLLVQGGSNSGATMPLSQRPITLGRRTDNDIVVDEETVSRRHALIMETPAGFVIRDLNTTNGTYVNRDKVGADEQVLRHGDRIKLAGSKITFVFRQEGTPTLAMQTLGPPMTLADFPAPGVSVRSGTQVKARPSPPSLTPKEMGLMRMLEARRGTVVSREDMARMVWPELPEPQSYPLIDESIEKIRASVEDNPARPVHLLTVGEFGYLLV